MGLIRDIEDKYNDNFFLMTQTNDIKEVKYYAGVLDGLDTALDAICDALGVDKHQVTWRQERKVKR